MDGPLCRRRRAITGNKRPLQLISASRAKCACARARHFLVYSLRHPITNMMIQHRRVLRCLPLSRVEYEAERGKSDDGCSGCISQRGISHSREKERERERERDARESSSSRARIQNALLIRGKTWHDIALHGHGSESANAWIHYLTADSTFEGVAGYFYPKFLTK